MHKAVQEAHTDQWEKRWAGDRLTLAEMDKRRFLEQESPRLKSEDLRELDRADHGATGWKVNLEADTANAREQLEALSGFLPCRRVLNPTFLLERTSSAPREC